MRNSFPVSFKGTLPASKSMLNRLLITQSFFPELQIHGESRSEDVHHLKHALKDFHSGKTDFDCGEAGTVFRFLALRVSRKPGIYHLKGSARLLKRPQRELVAILAQLGVRSELSENDLKIESDGWTIPSDGIFIDQSQSSQFASAVFLSSWRLPKELYISSEAGVSQDYLGLTLESLRQLGMQIDRTARGWKVAAQQVVHTSTALAECDLSSAAALACAGALAGRVEIENFPFQSLQPDARFIDFLKAMNVSVEKQDTNLVISQSENLRALQADFSECPDLVPIFSVLCAFANGVSVLSGATQLKHKESDRLEKSAELLRKAAVPVEIAGDALKISGLGDQFRSLSFVFDPDQDHRMAMAAGLMMTQGFSIELLTPSVVKKSYPEFWDHLGMTL